MIYNAGYSGHYTNPSGSLEYDGSSYGGNTWNSGGFETTLGLPQAVVAMDSGARRGRRRRNAMPTEIVEVKQDELMKKGHVLIRLSQPESRLVPHQPATSSSKGKVSKLHKRKHHITALSMDMNHKETELAERRSRGLLTRAETRHKLNTDGDLPLLFPQILATQKFVTGDSDERRL